MKKEMSEIEEKLEKGRAGNLFSRTQEMCGLFWKVGDPFQAFVLGIFGKCL